MGPEIPPSKKGHLTRNTLCPPPKARGTSYYWHIWGHPWQIVFNLMQLKKFGAKSYAGALPMGNPGSTPGRNMGPEISYPLEMTWDPGSGRDMAPGIPYPNPPPTHIHTVTVICENITFPQHHWQAVNNAHSH